MCWWVLFLRHGVRFGGIRPVCEVNVENLLRHKTEAGISSPSAESSL
jgi:hypothetical protein